MQVFEKLWKLLENIKFLNFLQQIEQKIIYYQSQIIILRTFSQEMLLIKHVHLGLSILELSKITMYGF